MSIDILEDKEAGFQITLPPGIQYRKLQTGYIFGHPDYEGLIMLLFHYNETLEEMKSDMEAGFYDESGFNLQVEGQLREINESTIIADYKGIAQGLPAVGYGIGVLSPYRGGLLVAIVSNPSAFDDRYMDLVDDMVQSVEFFEPEGGQIQVNWENFLTDRILKRATPGDTGIQRLYLKDNKSFLASFDLDYIIKGQDSPSNPNNSGEWEVVEVMDQPILNLSFFDGTDRQFTLQYEEGKLLMNNEYWEVEGDDGEDGDGPDDMDDLDDDGFDFEPDDSDPDDADDPEE
jgi:hypothetical protein